MKPKAKTVYLVCSIAFVIQLWCNNFALAEQNRLEEKEVLAVLSDLEAQDKFKPEEKEYILQNINRPELTWIIARWEKRNRTVLATKAKIKLLADYLHTERHYLSLRGWHEIEVKAVGICILPEYLYTTRAKEGNYSIHRPWGAKLFSRYGPCHGQIDRYEFQPVPEKHKIPRLPPDLIFTEGNRVEEKEVLAILASSRAGLKPEEKEYILQNVNRPELTSIIARWEERNGIILATKAKIKLLVGYLLVEQSLLERRHQQYRNWHEIEVKAAGIYRLSGYLDKISREKRFYTIGIDWGTDQGERFLAYPQKNEYGRLIIKSIPGESEVYLDGEFIDYSDKQFILTVGGHAVLVKNNGFQDFARKVKIKSGRRTVLKCRLVEQ